MDSTLGLTKTELEAEIGAFLGFGRGEAAGEDAWTAQQLALIASSRRAGLRSFYTASAGQDDNTQGYSWSFLRPLVSVAVEQANNRVPLPEHFGGIEGPLSVTSPASSVYRPVQLVGVPLIQEQYGKLPSLTGWPQLAALEPARLPTLTRSNRFQLYVWPIPDQAYVLRFTTFINPADLSDSLPYPLGAEEHSETIIAACLAAAEQRQDDMAGVQTMRFQAMLKGSISTDQRKKPQTVGYVGNRATQGYACDPREAQYNQETITFDGVRY